MPKSNFSKRVTSASDEWNVSPTARKGMAAWKKATFEQQTELLALAKELGEIEAGTSSSPRFASEVHETLCEKILDVILPSNAHLHDARKSQRGEYAAAFKTIPAHLEFANSLLTESRGDERGKGLAELISRYETMQAMHDYLIDEGKKAHKAASQARS